MKKGKFHQPVLAVEVIEYLKIKKGAEYIDATVGTGGHAIEIAKKRGKILGIDQDPEILKLAEARLSEICPKKDCFKLVHANFRKIDEVAFSEGFKQVMGILFDLGVANIHLTDAARGFSFASPEAELDMRLDPQSQSVTAADFLNVLRKDQLRTLFGSTLDSGGALWLAGRVIVFRESRSVKKVEDFLEICRGLRTKPGLNPATLPMLALRMAVNSELENLAEALPKAFGLLSRGGRLAVISFHSGEDRIVKEFFEKMETEKSAEIIGKELIVPSSAETEKNPRARSAKMRVCEKR